MVLLNGAFKRHQRQEPYRMSRGLILLDLMSSNNLPLAWEEYLLVDIEPFTIIYFDKNQNLQQWVWDGKLKHNQSMDPKKVHCWMSSPLYEDQERLERKKELIEVLDQDYSEQSIHNFQTRCRYKYKKYGRTFESIQTVSHTKAIIRGMGIELSYNDLRGAPGNNSEHRQQV